MIFAWKGNWGYTLNSIVPTKLSEIIFTDNNRPFTVFATDGEYDNIYGDNPRDLIEKIIEQVGDDFYYFYGGFTGRDDTEVTISDLNSFSNYVPSYLLSCPNYNNIAFNNQNELYAKYFLFENANKLLRMGQGTDCIVYGVNGDSLSVLFNGSFASIDKLFATLYNNIPYFIFDVLYCFNYTGTLISSSWKRAVGSISVRNNEFKMFTYNSANNSLLFSTALFSDNNPDWDFGPDNPYEPGGPSGPTDPDIPPGTFDDTSDPIPDSPLPTISSANTGFTRIYNPTLSQVQDLASYLWTTPDIVETIWNHIKQFFENPMEAMIGFNLVPVPVPDGGTTNFKLMYIDTGVQMTAAASQFVDRDCGTLKIERYYGSALDQSPYTKISCFLPYIGTVQLNTDEVMGTTLQVKYRVDICSGSCVAKIFVDGSCLYQYSGHCSIPIPFSAADFSSYVSAAVSVAKLAIGAATAGAAGVAAGAIPTAAQQTNQVITQATVSAPGSNLPALIPTRSQITDAPSDQSSTEASFSGISPTSISNTVGEIMTSKPHVEHSGSFSGNTGYLGIRRPYVIIERPNMCMPAQYQRFNGFPAMISMELSTCKGYTRIQQVQLTGMTATNPEQAEILELLKSGVVF